MKTRIGPVDDPLEHEADQVADAVITGRPVGVMGGAPSAIVRRKCAQCEEEDQSAIRRKESTAPTSQADSQGAAKAAADAVSRGGAPLTPVERAYFEPRFGRDFSTVRIHAGAAAASAANRIGARAYTLGGDIGFAAGEYSPATAAGKRLVAHELAHTLQDSRGRGLSPVIHRQPKEDDDKRRDFSVKADPALIGALPVPGTGITVTPGPIAPVSLVGTKLPLPTNLVVTNLGGGGRIPSFIARISPQGFVGALLGSIDLSTSLRPGVPPQRIGEPDSLKRISLVNPVVTIDPTTGNLSGFATLSVGSDYPPWIKPSTNLDVSVTSTRLGQFSLNTSYAGIVNSDFELTLKYNVPTIESSLKPAYAPAGGFDAAGRRFRKILTDNVPGIDLESIPKGVVRLLDAAAAGKVKGTAFASAVLQEIASSIPAGINLERVELALSQFADELTHPGYEAKGTVKLGQLPITTFSAESTGGKAPTTSYLAAGVIIVPPGTIASVPAPALGATYEKATPKDKWSLNVAALPTLSTDAIGKHAPFVEQFPIYTYGEVAYTRSLGNEVKVGVRLTVNISTPTIAEKFGAPKVGDTKGKPSEFRPGPPEPPGDSPPNVSLTLFGNF